MCRTSSCFLHMWPDSTRAGFVDTNLGTDFTRRIAQCSPEVSHELPLYHTGVVTNVMGTPRSWDQNLRECIANNSFGWPLHCARTVSRESRARRVKLLRSCLSRAEYIVMGVYLKWTHSPSKHEMHTHTYACVCDGLIGDSFLTKCPEQYLISPNCPEHA